MHKLHIQELLKELPKELPDLVGDRADGIGRQLEEMSLAVARGNATQEEVLAELARYPELRRWLQDRLGIADQRGSLGFGYRSGYRPPAGSGAAVGSREFVCPEPGCDMRWFRRSVGQRPPLCERHGRRLVLKYPQD